MVSWNKVHVFLSNIKRQAKDFFPSGVDKTLGLQHSTTVAVSGSGWNELCAELYESLTGIITLQPILVISKSKEQIMIWKKLFNPIKHCVP